MMQFRSWTWPSAIWPLTAVTLAVMGCRHSSGTAAPKASRAVKMSQTSDLILVDEGQPWLLAVACPVAGSLRDHQQLPWLAAIAPSPAAEAVRLVDRLAPRRTLLLGAGPMPLVAEQLGNQRPEFFATGDDPALGSLAVARRFWPAAPEVVVARVDEPEAILQGAILAGRLGGPLLLDDPKRVDHAPLVETLRQLHVERILLVTQSAGPPPKWSLSIARRVEFLSLPAIQERLLGGLDPGSVRTIVLARVPDAEHSAGRTAWLAPYVSLVRRAPLVLCHAASAEEAESAVDALVRGHRLAPSTVTILADYHSIGTHPVPVASDEDPGEVRYKVQTEPCLPMGFERLVTVGVGRISFASLQEASMLFLRGLARQQLLAGRPSRALMLANPSLNNLELPLCEAISRLTVAELRNFGLPVDEFYRQPGNRPEVMDRAADADLIIYEGHTEHEGLLTDPAYEYHPDAAARPAARRFDAAPVIILQTCDSLQNEMLWRVHGAGGVALLGSSTPIHSASGAGFAKAVHDAILYRRATLGEALRDAQNYFFCLQDLKDLRHHRERSKSQRVALSFRLWGDPELCVLPEELPAPRQAPVTARWQPPRDVVIETPAARFAEIRNESYSAHFFPGSEAAGMVLRLKDEPARKILPVYFFRLPLADAPAGAAAGRGTSAAGENRVIFRVDPAGRFLYVLYFPEKEAAHETLIFPWTGRPAGAAPNPGLRSARR
jgi:hypothetical protein